MMMYTWFKASNSGWENECLWSESEDIADNKEKYNKIQYKLWEKAEVSGKYSSKSDPP